jgi:hypothetical protein
MLRGSCSALKEAASVAICDTFSIPLVCRRTSTAAGNVATA